MTNCGYVFIQNIRYLTATTDVYKRQVPFLGMIFYIYFGVNYRKSKMFSMKGLGDMKWLQYMSEDQKQRLKKAELLKKEDMKEVRKLMTLLLNNSKALLTRYNKVDVLNNGKETFPAIFTALSKARRYIHLEYYICLLYTSRCV